MTAMQNGFRVAQIVYFTDLSRADALVIPLGSLAEIVLPHIRGLGLKARANLTPDELKLVSPLIRDRLAMPFAFFKMEFDLAWERVRGTEDLALDVLTRQHASSLSVLAPSAYCKADSFMRLELPARREAVVAQLSGAVIHEYDALQMRFGARSENSESAYREDERLVA